jgi:thiol-disulfide isomerase/thioredoxin
LNVGAGIAAITLAVGLTFNLTDALQRAIPDYTTAISESIEKAIPAPVIAPDGAAVSQSLASCLESAWFGHSGEQDCGPAPQLSGIQQWLNTPGNTSVDLQSLRGKVVLVDFWAFSCINCQRTIEHITDWHSTYQTQGFEVIGVHTPEYTFERDTGNVIDGAERLNIDYPIALDNNYSTWTDYGVSAWPTSFLIDANGTVRQVTIGEGGYEETEQLIRTLLAEAAAE